MLLQWIEKCLFSDGLQLLGYIMSECLHLLIMLSRRNSADVTINKPFTYGAVDFIQKPSGNIRLDIAVIKDELIKKVKAAAGVKTSKLVFLDEK